MVSDKNCQWAGKNVKEGDRDRGWDRGWDGDRDGDRDRDRDRGRKTIVLLSRIWS
jgi:hypothetical protein